MTSVHSVWRIIPFWLRLPARMIRQPGTYQVERIIDSCQHKSRRLSTACDRDGERTPPFLLIQQVPVVLSVRTNTSRPLRRGRKAQNANLTSSIFSRLTCRACCDGPQRPDVTWVAKWVPQPCRETSVNRCSDGRGSDLGTLCLSQRGWPHC